MNTNKYLLLSYLAYLLHLSLRRETYHFAEQRKLYSVCKMRGNRREGAYDMIAKKHY